MNSQILSRAQKRCLSEKNRLEAAVWSCDYCSNSYKNHRKCYNNVSKKIIRKMHNCLIP